MIRPIITLLCVSLCACSNDKKTQEATEVTTSIAAPVPAASVKGPSQEDAHYDCACMLVPVEACDNACCDPNSATLLEEDCKCVVE